MKKVVFSVALAAIILTVSVFFVPREEKNPDSYCSLEIECSELLEEPERLAADKREIVPEDGIVYKNERAAFASGETVDDILIRELRENKIHIEYSKASGYNTAYVEGIANLYQKDAGELSGWLFFVNGRSAEVGSSQYEVKPGDKIKWVYSCDFTRTEHQQK